MKGVKSATLTMKEVIELSKIIKARYAASGLDDAAFTLTVNADARESALFRNGGVTKSNVSSTREAMGVPNNHARGSYKTAGEALLFADRVAGLEDRVAKLAKTVDMLRDKVLGDR